MTKSLLKIVSEDNKHLFDDADLEQAQILAACLGLIRLEVKKIRNSVQEQLSTVGVTEDKIVALAQHEISKALVENVKDGEIKLPDELIYESHLDEMKWSFNKLLKETSTSLSTDLKALTEKVDLTTRNLQDSDATLEESLDAAKRDLRALLEETTAGLQEDLTSSTGLLRENMRLFYGDTINQFTDVMHSLDTEADNREKAEAEIRDFFNTQLAAVTDAVDRFKADQKQWTEDHELRHMEMDHAHEKLADELEAESLARQNAQTTIVQDLDAHTEQLLSQDAKIDELGRTKSDATHTHDDVYSPIDHEHYHLADKTEVAAVRDEITDTKALAMDMSIRIRGILDELDAKANKTELLSDDDLEGLAKRIHDAVILSIPTPEDGKDAFEWEFKFHETQRGLLLYKREDWKHWRTQNLLGPSQIMPDLSSHGQAGGAINVFHATPIYVYHNNQLFDKDNGSIIEMSMIAYTDENGYFEYQSDFFEHADVMYHYSAEAAGMVADPSLAPENRVIDAYIEEITTGGLVKGYAFLVRNSRSLIGTLNKTLNPAPTGTQVMIKIVGAHVDS